MCRQRLLYNFMKADISLLLATLRETTTNDLNGIKNKVEAFR